MDEAGCLLCSRNARPQKALVERAQSKATQPHPRWVAWIGEVDHNREWKILSGIKEIKGRQIVDFRGNS